MRPGPVDEGKHRVAGKEEAVPTLLVVELLPRCLDNRMGLCMSPPGGGDLALETSRRPKVGGGVAQD